MTNYQPLIRDRLVASGDNKIRIGAQYFGALNRGDADFVRAVEGAPSSFPLLTNTDREKGELEKIKQSPLASEIEAAEHEWDLFNRIVGMTATQLGKMEGRYPGRLTFVTVNSSFRFRGFKFLFLYSDTYFKKLATRSCAPAILRIQLFLLTVCG